MLHFFYIIYKNNNSFLSIKLTLFSVYGMPYIRRVRECAVDGCYGRSVKRKHRFPVNDPLRLPIWIESTGNPNLLNIPPKKIYSSFLICDRHFESSCHSPRTNKLNKDSIPTLFLPKRK